GRDMAAHGRVLGPEGEAGFAWMAQDLNPGGATGDARFADAALGARLVEHFAVALARVIEDTRDVDLAALGPAGEGGAARRWARGRRSLATCPGHACSPHLARRIRP